MEIATWRLLLRDFEPGDLAPFAAYHADPRYAELYGPLDRRPLRAADLLSTFLRWAGERPRRNYQLAIVREGRLIGCGGVRTLGQPPGRAELGLELGPRWWGLGHGSEAASALLRLAFVDLGAHEVRGDATAGNARVERLLLRLGFERVATRGTRTEWKLGRAAWSASGGDAP